MAVIKPHNPVHKAWGVYQNFYESEKMVIKMLEIQSGKKISYQRHKNRMEYWEVSAGEGQLALEGEIINLKKGDSFLVPIGVLHQVKCNENDNKQSLVCIEVQIGNPDENDIERVEDIL